MGSVFSKIVTGEISSYKIMEDDSFLAFLDVSPLQIGHTLVIPKKEIDFIFDIDDSQLAEMMLFAKKVAAKIKKSIPCKRIGVAVIGLEVPHAHIHLIPINTMNDMNFGNPKLTLNQDKLREVADKISAA